MSLARITEEEKKKHLLSPEPNEDIRPPVVIPEAPKKRRVDVVPLREKKDRPVRRILFETEEESKIELTEGRTDENREKYDSDDMVLKLSFVQRAVVKIIILSKLHFMQSEDEKRVTLKELLQKIENDTKSFPRTSLERAHPIPGEFIEELHDKYELDDLEIELIDTAADWEKLEEMVASVRNGKYSESFFKCLNLILKWT